MSDKFRAQRVSLFTISLTAAVLQSCKMKSRVRGLTSDTEHVLRVQVNNGTAYVFLLLINLESNGTDHALDSYVSKKS